MRVVIPEYKNRVMKQAMMLCSDLEFVHANSLEEGLEIVKEKNAALVAGIDITTRDMVLACKNVLEKTDSYFSSCFVMQKGKKKFVLADAGVCKKTSAEVLKTIVVQTYETAKKVLDDTPRIAILSFSSFGSGGEDASLLKIREAIEMVRSEHSEIVIDGEMQLDAAIDRNIARKKATDSSVAGRANVLVCPDLTSANILYKSMERFGGFTAAGPILQGFGAKRDDGCIIPAIISDLSRGSTVKDVVLTLRMLEKIHN